MNLTSIGNDTITKPLSIAITVEQARELEHLRVSEGISASVLVRVLLHSFFTMNMYSKEMTVQKACEERERARKARQVTQFKKK